MDKENGNRKRSAKGKVKGQKEKRKGKSYRGNNNRGEIGD
jgi:hypothetical protein